MLIPGKPLLRALSVRRGLCSLPAKQDASKFTQDPQDTEARSTDKTYLVVGTCELQGRLNPQAARLDLGDRYKHKDNNNVKGDRPCVVWNAAPPRMDEVRTVIFPVT